MNIEERSQFEKTILEGIKSNSVNQRGSMFTPDSQDMSSKFPIVS